MVFSALKKLNTNFLFYTNFSGWSWSSQKNTRVRKILVRNSGAGDGCANFMGALNFCVLSAKKPPCPHKFLVLGGGGYFGFGGGGGKVPILFLWARGFF